MAGTEVIRELVNVVGLEVDKASAAQADAAMKQWAANAEHIGKVVAEAAGGLADFLNKTNRIGKALEKLAPVMEKTGVGLEKFAHATTASAIHMGSAAVKAGNLKKEVSEIGKETWLAAKKTSALGTGLQDLAKGVMDTQRAEAMAARVTRQATSARSSSAKEAEKSTGFLERFGLQMLGVREVVNLVTSSFRTFVTDVVATSKSMTDSARVAGVATRFFQETAYATQSVGIGVDELRGFFVDLSDKAVNGGADVKKLFRSLGVSVRDASGKVRSSQDLFLQVVDGFEKMSDGQKRSATMSKLFGDKYAKLLPLFAKGRGGLQELAEEGHALGVVLDDDMMASTAAFDDVYGKFSNAMLGFRNVLGGLLLPALTKLTKGLLDVSKRLLPIVRSKAAKWAKVFASAVDFATTGVDKLKLALLLAAGALLGKYLMALSTVTAAQLTWGSAALIAGARAALAAALPIIPWLALGALIALVTEDIYGFATGSESALGDFIKWVDKVEPEDNNLVKMLKRAASLVFDVTDTKKWTKFASSLQELQVGILKELVVALTRLLDLVKRIPGVISNLHNPFKFTPSSAQPGGAGVSAADAERFSAAGRVASTRIRYNAAPRGALSGFFAGSYQTADQAAVERARRLGSRNWVSQYGLDAASIPSGPDAGGAYFGRGSSASTAVPAMARGGQGPGVFAPATNISMTVQALPGQSPEAVGSGAMSTAYDRADQEKRAAFALFTRR